jgi:PIN domain nuclease of toxin-antitoxin system
VKTYVFDASAVLAYLNKSAGASKVAELLLEAARERAHIVMSAVNLGEVFGRILRDHGEPEARRFRSVAHALPMELVDATPQRAMEAAEVKVKYKLYYADSFAAALAIEQKATLVTGDSDFRKLGHGVGVVWLKN